MNIDFVPFERAFVSETVGRYKIKESEYHDSGSIKVVDQGQNLISGFTDRTDLVRKNTPYIVFGDHTKVIKLVDFEFVVGADGVRLYKAAEGFDAEFLFLFLKSSVLPTDGYGRHSKYLNDLFIPKIDLENQCRITTKLKAQLAEVETARQALECQQQEIVNLANAYICESIEPSFNMGVGAGHARDLNHAGDDGIYSRAWPAPTDDPISVTETRLGDVLDEIKQGIGANWAEYPVLGATRNGLAPAKEPPGKQPQRYKPVFSGTVFYNPMRILIGSIAFVDDDDEPGITSPDYVVLQGKNGVVDSRWFYYWLRSPYGVQCINSLARGAVRERMLFNRLAEGSILLPPYQEQLRVSKALAQLKSVKSGIQKQLDELNKIPERLLAQAFGNND
ncbi:MAG: hypothetical protein HOP23_14530 [Methylococcaceae bacterium]|nr:hypothetical protein [Methylococcaceae bacterium]